MDGKLYKGENWKNNWINVVKILKEILYLPLYTMIVSEGIKPGSTYIKGLVWQIECVKITRRSKKVHGKCMCMTWTE